MPQCIRFLPNLGIHVQNDHPNYSNTVTTDKLNIEAEWILKSVFNLDSEQKQKIRDYYRDSEENISVEKFISKIDTIKTFPSRIGFCYGR